MALSYLAEPRPAPHITASLRPWLPLLTLLHEQVHQLGLAKPAWLGESLAQYYALQALGRIGVLTAADCAQAFDRITRPWSRTPKKDALTTLLTAQRRYVRTGSVAWYRIFYTHGPRFWRAVDRAVAKRSDRRRSLDTLVPALRKLPYGPGGRPPALSTICSSPTAARRSSACSPAGSALDPAERRSRAEKRPAWPEGQTLGALIERMQQGRPGPPRRPGPGDDVPPAVLEAVAQSLHPDPRARWASLDELLVEVRRAAFPPRDASARGWGAVWRPAVIIGLVAAQGIAIGVAVMLSGDKPSADTTLDVFAH